MEEIKRYTVEQLKEKRVEIDALFKFFKNEQDNGEKGQMTTDFELESMASYQTLIALKSAKMWIGVMLEAKGNPFPVELADNSK